VKLVVVDIGCGNIGSVRLAFGRFGIEPVIASDPETIRGADKIILPGVGAAGFAMERIDGLGLRETLTSLRQPALGICLGMQLLFDSSDEENTVCLGIIPGRVRRLRAEPGLPVPHMGWSQVEVRDPALGIGKGDYLYFAHSYACDDGPAAVATTRYASDVAAVVRRNNWLGAQFHPERSGEAGARFLESFLA
jgi:glutamine amidotransferase